MKPGRIPFIEWSDEQQLTFVRTIHPLLSRLCHLQEKIGRHIGYDHAADCFCGEGGYWPDAMPSWRHDQKTIDFLERAVSAAITNPELFFAEVTP